MKRKHTFRFKVNYNNKLCCEYFSTIRAIKADVEVGDTAECLITGVPDSNFDVEVIMVIRTSMGKINDLVAFLDCGQNKDAFRQLMQQSYRRDVGSGALYLYLLKRRARLL